MASETPGSTVSLVGQGSFLTKPSLHMVGCTGKKSSTFTTPPDGLCPLCKTKGQSQVLKTYRINFTQSIFLCSDPQCIYPLGYTPLDNIITSTEDLSLGTSKRIKRNISELSPPSQSNVKRSKSNLSFPDQYSPKNAATSVQVENSTSVLVVPPWQHDATPSGKSYCGWPENAEVPKQNVPETSSSFSSSTSVVLNSSLPSPLPPPGSSKLFIAVQDRLFEKPHQSEDDKMTDILYSTIIANKSLNNNETEGLEESVDKELGKPEPPCPMPKSLNLVSENRISLNGSSRILGSNELSPDSVPFSQCKVFPTQLQQKRLCSQMDKSLHEVPNNLNHGSLAKQVPGISLRDMGSAQPCNVIQSSQQDFCESKESHLLQCMDDVKHNPVAVVDYHRAESIQHRDLSMFQDLIEDRQSASFESTVPPLPEQHNKAKQDLNKTSLKSICPHVETSEENINSDAVGALETKFSKSLHLKQDALETTSTSYSLHHIQPTCLADNDSVDVCEPLCTMASVMKDCSIEKLTVAPFKVCHLSTSVQLVEDIEKMHIETTPLSGSVKDNLSELSLEVDLSLNMPGIPSRSDAVIDSSAVRPEKTSLQEGQFSNHDDIVISCEQSCSETDTSPTIVKDILLECQSKEKSLSDVPLSPCFSPSIPTDKHSPSVASAGSVISNSSLPEQLDLIYDCQKSFCDRITPSDYIQVTRSVYDDSSVIGVCNTVSFVSEKDDSCTEQEITPLADNPLKTENLTQLSVEVYGVNASPHQAAFTIKDSSVSNVTCSSCNITPSMDDGDSTKISALLSDSQIENSGSTPTACSQAEDVVEEACRFHATVAAVEEDIGSGNQVTSPLSETRESKKTSFENAVLPDLLLDIQPEQLMEEQLSAIPSPAVSMVTTSIDCKQPEEGHLLQARQDKLWVQEEEMNKMDKTDPDNSTDNLHNSIHLSDTLCSERTVNNDGIGSVNLDLSAINKEQGLSDEIIEARTYENSQRRLQWKNKKSLCWLDCIFSSLVQSRNLRVFVAKHGNHKESIIHNLFAKYEEATELCKGIIKNNKAEVPSKAEACLHEVRRHIFDKLKPLLKCELGQNESPVFAFPLLLRLDPDFQELFIHSFSWNFKCESCGFTYQDRCQKTLTSLTKIVQDWHPLNAVHRSPCNKCQAADQRREMHLETLQSMFMLHFVEGLPSSDLNWYAFQFGEHWYEVKTVIRYRDQHFSTWMANDDDTWLESDDLKGTFCRRYHKFRMRAEDIHIVIWERTNAKKIQEEHSQLSSTVFVSEIKSENQTSVPAAEMIASDLSRESPMCAPIIEVGEPASTKYLPQIPLASESVLLDPSTVHPPHIAPVVETNLPAPPLVVPVSGSIPENISTSLAGMEGYADDDIITLTLVEIPFDSMGQPVAPKSLNSGVTHVEKTQDNVLHPSSAEMQNDSTKLPQHTEPRPSTQLSFKSPKAAAAPAPICTIQQSPGKPCRQWKRTNNTQEAAVATSTPSSKTFSTKKSVVDNLMSSLVKNDQFFLNSSLLSANRKTTTSKTWQPATLLKESDFNGATKKAENFNGFQAKTVSNINNSVGSTFNVPKEKSAPSVKSFLAPTAFGHRNHRKDGLSYGKMLPKDGSLTGEHKIKKLRIKLLKKLNAKKNELAMLEKMAKLQQNSSCAGESNGVLSGGVSRQEHLRGFLQELQDQIDNESNGTMSSCTSICSSPGDAEFFAELFSPSPVNNPENDSKFLEMLADGYGISADHSQQTAGFNCPMNNTTPQSTSGADSLPNVFNHSSSGEESLNLLSSSTMSVLNEDTGYLDSFVDIF